MQSYAIESKLLSDSSVLNLGNDTSICEGSSIVLSADSGYYKYQWSTGDTTHSILVSDSGNYIVFVYDDSLNLIDADTIRIRLNKLPNSSFKIYNISPQWTFQFEAIQVPGYLYYWDFGDGGKSILINPIHTYNIQGSYNVKLKIVNYITKCVDSTTHYVYVGIDESKLNLFNINVVSNPFQNNAILKFELFKNAQIVNLDIYDLMGRKIKNVINNENKMNGVHELTLTLDNLNGMFIVKLSVDDIVSTYKIINDN